MSDTAQPTVLVVEDEDDVAKSYEIWLETEYDVRRAADGSEALSTLDDEIDVVLLDRMMPGLSGAEVLERIEDSEYDPRVAMVTAVDPDFDIIGMGFDDYVTKPPSREGLLDTVSALLERNQYADSVQEYRSLVAKRSALEAEKPQNELAGTEEYERLEAEIEHVESDLEEDEDHLLDDAAFVGQLRDLSEDEGQ